MEKASNQIDCILIKVRFRNYLKQGKTYIGTDINSDHSQLITKMKIQVKKLITTKNNKHLDTNPFNNSSYAVRYNDELRKQI